MRRKLFNLAAAVSLLLCMGTAALWVRSSYEQMGIAWASRSGSAAFSCDSLWGRLELTIIRQNYGFPPPGWRYWQEHTLVSRGDWTGIFLGCFGFAVHGLNAAENGFYDYLPGYGVAIPYWFPLLVTVFLPVRWLFVWNRPKVGCCRHCRYNLTGNTSGICPECGTPVTEKAQAKA